MINKCSNCKYNDNDFCDIGRSCYKYSQFEPINKNSDVKQSEDKQEFTKDDLKIGMIVELRNGEKCLVKQHGIATIEKDNFYLSEIIENDLRVKGVMGYLKEYDIVKVYTTNNLIEVLEGKYDSLELIWERDAFDWSKVNIDERILVSMDNEKWERRHFAKYENGQIYAWHNGYTAFTAPIENYYDFFSAWKFAKLYKEDEA